VSEAAGGAWRLLVHEVLPSTSDLCRELAGRGEPEGLAVLALRQTRGRGSRGRAWDSPAGNLHLSVLLRPVEWARSTGQWALLAAVALRQTLAEWAPRDASFRLKWPNDLLLDGRKLAGILIDSSVGASGRLDWLVVGIGVNLAHAPPLAGRATASLAELVTAPSPVAVADRLLVRLDGWRRVRQQEGFDAIRTAWLAHGPQMDEPVTLKVGDCLVEGAFAGIGDDGGLKLCVGGAVQTFTTGDMLLAKQDGDTPANAVRRSLRPSPPASGGEGRVRG
jgi:BirA family biotin operon repressor/biotin-[acetyl-CoA-carboxylase] ligase